MKVLRFLDENFERIFLTILLATMSVVIGVQVFMRYIFRASLSWSEELTRYCFVWMCYIGISYGVKMQRHIKVDAVALLLPKKIQKYLGILANLIFLGFALMMIQESWGVREMIAELGQESPAIGIPMQWVYTAVPFGFCMVIFRICQNLVLQFRDLNAKAA